jgi:hypothetical protein
MIAATVAATLRALGMGAPLPTPLPPAPPPYNPYVVQQQQAARQIGLGDLVTDLKGQVAAFREFGKIKRDFESLGNLFGSEQEEEPPQAAAPIVPASDSNAPPFGVRKIPFSGSPLSGGQDINWVDQYTTDADGERVKKPLQDWAMQLSAVNPQLTANMIEQLTRIIDNSSIGSLVKKFAESGAAAQQTAARAPAALGAGAMPNGVAQPGGYSPP